MNYRTMATLPLSALCVLIFCSCSGEKEATAEKAPPSLVVRFAPPEDPANEQRGDIRVTSDPGVGNTVTVHHDHWGGRPFTLSYGRTTKDFFGEISVEREAEGATVAVLNPPLNSDQMVGESLEHILTLDNTDLKVAPPPYIIRVDADARLNVRICQVFTESSCCVQGLLTFSEKEGKPFVEVNEECEVGTQLARENSSPTQ